MTDRQLRCEIAGKTGSIYIARKGTVTVIDIDGGNTYMVHNTSGSIITNPIHQYWIHAIDWAGGYTDYFWTGVIPSANPRFRADPIVPLTADQLLALNR
jgi:hypothetical protein